MKNKKKEMNLAKKEKPKPAGPMKKIGKAWPNEDDQPPIAGEFCWMVQLCTVGSRVAPSVLTTRSCSRVQHFLPGCACLLAFRWVMPS